MGRGTELGKWTVRHRAFENEKSKILSRRSDPIAIAIGAYLVARLNGALQDEIQEHTDRINGLSENLKIPIEEIETILGFILEI